MIEILACGPLGSVQDLGREGYLRFGVGEAGAMDRLALMIGNLMLDNPAGLAGIEIAVFPFQARFLQDIAFAVTGADRAAQLDGRPLLPWWTQVARAGQVLTLSGSGVDHGAGARSYLLCEGGMDVPLVLGSRSTQLRGRFGGHMGRTLVQGDIVRSGVAERRGASSPPQDCSYGFGVLPPEHALPWAAFCNAGAGNPDIATAVRVVPAAEYRNFDDVSVQNFWDSVWRISAQSDRYGFRLAGPGLALREPMETRSHGIVPGVIQVPPNGQPIIQMRDAQPTGGYPKVGTVIEADLWRLSQAPTGAWIRFVCVSYEASVCALDDLDAYLARLKRHIALYRQAAA
ncbi:MAG: biotin-dependent carboxyltransferase family protein [Burkholderiaceae bacterium]